VSERPSARLVAVTPRTWRTYADLVDLFHGPADQHWAEDRDLIDQRLADPKLT
jgi:hypothetical protein